MKSNVNFIGDRGSNLLYVSAPSERMKEIDARVQELLASQAEHDMTFAIRHFDVKQATPEDVANMIDAAAARRGSRSWRARAAAGDRAAASRRSIPQRTAHRVTVAAPAAMMSEIEELIKQFDQPTAASTMRIVALKTAKAEKIASIIEANIEEGQTRSSSHAVSSRTTVFAPAATSIRAIRRSAAAAGQRTCRCRRSNRATR